MEKKIQEQNRKRMEQKLRNNWKLQENSDKTFLEEKN